LKNIKHRAYHFAKQVVLFIGEREYAKTYHSVVDQLLRSATSVGANLVEGHAGSSTRDFVKFYTIALKSANETKYWICLLRDTIWKDKETELNDLLNEVDEISKIVASIVIKVKSKNLSK